MTRAILLAYRNLRVFDWRPYYGWKFLVDEFYEVGKFFCPGVMMVSANQSEDSSFTTRSLSGTQSEISGYGSYSAVIKTPQSDRR